jgi:hypothetical protein
MKPPRLLSLGLLAAALSLNPAAAQEYAMNAAAVGKGGHFVKPAEFEIARILPEPPAPDSLAAQADLETVLQVQAWRTPEQEALAKAVDKDTPFNHASVIGAWFTKENLPVTAAFLERGDRGRERGGCADQGAACAPASAAG